MSFDKFRMDTIWLITHSLTQLQIPNHSALDQLYHNFMEITMIQLEDFILKALTGKNNDLEVSCNTPIDLALP